jgi:arylsulfatase A-like enzyme
MKKILVLLAGAWALATAATPSQPNIIFILADDLGWSDTTLYGNTHYYRTPNLERLAKRGMVYTRAYAASPLCSPTRASILTGQSPARLGITAPAAHTPKVKLTPSINPKAAPTSKTLSYETATRLNTTHFTLAEALKGAGYATGHFGKWHLGETPYSPLEQGFDVDMPHWPGPGPAGSFVAPWKFPNFKERTPLEHIEDRMADEAAAWMEKNKDRPFFLNYWQFSVHAPFNAKAALIEKYRKLIDPQDAQRSPTYAAMVESMDDAVGRLLDTVDRLGLAERTIIVFYSDNGGNMYNTVDETTATSNRPLRSGKASPYEGGIRVPCVIAWPGKTKPGSRNDAVIQSSDFYPTFLDGLGLKTSPSQIFDGLSITPTFTGQPLGREAIFTYFPHSPPAVADRLPPSISAVSADWKLIRLFWEGEGGRTHAYRLYNLKDDVGETRDLVAAEPERVKAMDRLIEQFLENTHALTPPPNTDYNPKAKAAPANPKKKAPKQAAATHGSERTALEAESDAGL